MADLISVVGRLLAFEKGKAVRMAGQRQIALQPHALILCTLAMAGEDTTVHAMAVGCAGQPAQVRVVPDPRVRDAHYALFESLLGVIEPYFQNCRARGDFPQIWVASGAGVAHLDTLADRLRYNTQHEAARRLGSLLSYATERSPVTGQQALIGATAALRLHYATGQQDGEDEHLGAFLTWIEPPAGQRVQSAVELIERQPMGVNTDPAFDAAHLAPRLEDYHAALKRSASREETLEREALIAAQLTPVIESIYHAVQKAYAIIEHFSHHEAPLMSHLRQIEAQRFEHFMAARDQGHPLPYRDQPKAAAFRIAEREEMIELNEAAWIRCDGVARARAYLKGDVLRGIVGAVEQQRIGYRTIYRLQIQTDQPVLRARPGETLASIADGRLTFEVMNIERRGGSTIVHVTVTAGMRAVGCPEVGDVVELGPEEADWGKPYREFGQMAERLANAPWTHTANCPEATPTSLNRPADLVGDVEDVR